MQLRCVAALTAVAFVVSGCGASEPGKSRARDIRQTTTLRSEALSLEVPHGWYGNDVNPERPEPYAPTLHVATFPLPPRPLDQGQHEQASMGDDDILVSITDYGVPPEGRNDLSVVTLPTTVGRSDMASFEGFREPVASTAFLVNGHTVQIWVVFGSPNPTAELFARANHALATLAVAPEAP